MGKNRRHNRQQQQSAGDGAGDLADNLAQVSIEPPMAGVQGAQAGAARGRGRGRGRKRDTNQEEEDFPVLGGGGGGGPPPGMAPPTSQRGPPPGLAPQPGPPPGLARPPAPVQQTAPPPQQRAAPAPQMTAPQAQRPAQQPQRSAHQPQGKVRTVTQQELTEQHYDAMDLHPPKRPGYGQRCARPIDLHTNHFTISINLRGQIHHYDVAIEELDAAPVKTKRDIKLPKKLLRHLVDTVARDNPQLFAKFKYVYDGMANLYTPQALQLQGPDGHSQRFDVAFVSDRGKKERFAVTLKYAATIALSDIDRYMRGDINNMPQNAVNAIDNVFRQHAMARPNMIGYGRSFYVKPNNPNAAYLGEGREIWMGYFQSARISNQKSLTLNIDITATTFYTEQDLAQFTLEFLKLRENDTRPLKEMQVARLRRELSDLKAEVNYAHFKKQRKITSISLRAASSQMFTLDANNNRQISVARYFQEKYKMPLRYPHLPCVQFGKRDGQTFIPMELCRLVGGQRGQRKMTSDQTSAMIRRTAMPPAERQNQILQRVRESNFSQDPYTRAFGMEVNPQMIRLGGRVLPTPQMVYDQNKRTNPRAGAWDPKFLQFYKSTGKPITNWGMVNFCNRTGPDKLNNFLQQMCSHASKLGVQFTKPTYTEDVQLSEARRFLARVADEGCTFLICVLPGNNPDIYGQIKYTANVEYGIMTQCLKSSTVMKCNPMLLGNVLQKINAKLGGINHIPFDQYLMSGVMSKPTIIFGADVTHPAPGDKMRPSISALVASMDRNACKYEARQDVQTHRKEIIVDLAGMAKELLMAFYRNTKLKPEKIVIYRDGVSEGQFLQVLNSELRALQRACSDLQADYQPGITFLVVQKRHHTRFFPTNPNDGEGKHKNIPAGTCVDSVVTHPTEHDFYLCSHAGIQGTSKPAHYHVLWDDNNMSADDVQALSFYLCHCYSNCSRSVSIPAPTYYAHKVAAMARIHLEPVFESGSMNSGSSCSSNGEPTDDMRKAIRLAENLPKMFFL